MKEDFRLIKPVMIWTIDVFPPMEIRVCSNNAILSIDGKIAMDCYGRVLDFFSRCIAAQLQEFALSKALTVWIDG